MSVGVEVFCDLFHTRRLVDSLCNKAPDFAFHLFPGAEEPEEQKVRREKYPIVIHCNLLLQPAFLLDPIWWKTRAKVLEDKHAKGQQSTILMI